MCSQRAIMAIASLPPNVILEYKRHASYTPPGGQPLKYQVSVSVCVCVCVCVCDSVSVYLRLPVCLSYTSRMCSLIPIECVLLYL